VLELFALPCPLTPLENLFRTRAGEGQYGGGFLEHYLIPLIYPGGLTREVMIALGLLGLLGLLVLVVNGVVYAWIWRCGERR